MTTPRRSTLFALALAAWLLPVGSQAHYLWLEAPEGTEARLYFGEYEQQLREKSPGALDRIVGPQAWQLGADGTRKPVAIALKDGHFAIASGSRPVLVEQQPDKVVDMSMHGGTGRVRSIRYARLDAPGADARPALALDIVPVRAGAALYRVVADGAPLAKAKVELHAPNGWSRELTTDAQGQVRISAPWPGTYVLQTSQTLAQPGELKGERYDGLRRSVTLSVTFAEPLAER